MDNSEPELHVNRVHTLPWYDRLYVWCRKHFFSESEEKALETDTCKYYRTLLVSLPVMVAIFFMMTFVLIAVAFIVISAMINATWTWSAVLSVLGAIAFVIALVVGVLGTMIVLVVWITYLFDKFGNPFDKVPSNIKPFKPFGWTQSQFWQTIVKCIKDKHDKICTKFSLGEKI